jgi:hypothetical protein
MDLYTSLTQFKMAINGGVMPPMTPLSEKALLLFDPEFTIGMGALVEDAERGLRCPMRGCGEFHHRLGAHLSRKHRTVGADGVRRALSIPSRAPLLSHRAQHDMVRHFAHLRGVPRPAALKPPRNRDRRANGRSSSRSSSSIGAFNLRDRCEAQMRTKLLDLYLSIGRSPTYREAAASLGEATVKAALKLWGSWNNTVLSMGWEPRRAGIKQRPSEAVIEALRAWYDVHGDLPNFAAARNTTPLLPHPNTIIRALGAQSWVEAMEITASLLDIHGGRYGLPERAA